MNCKGCENSSPTNKPNIEIADIFREYGQEYLNTHNVSSEQIEVINKIITCRTAAQGGHIEFCDNCGHHRNAYNSCRNRHCPKCQTMAKEEWLDNRKAELLPVPYFHLVFTLPHDLNPLILNNSRVLLKLLFSSVNEVIKAFAADPQWRLEGKPGFIGVLHTWTQTLLDHFHIHCLIPGGVLSKDKTKWIPSKSNFLFKTSSLMLAFKNIYLKGLKELREKGELEFSGNTAKYENDLEFNKLIKKVGKKKWCGYAKKPFSGPEKVLEYLGRYVHKVAISNYRIISLENGVVTFTWKDRSDNNATKFMKLKADEFMRRFLLHVLPKRFRKIRYFGFLSPRYKKVNILLIRELLCVVGEIFTPPVNESIEEKMLRLTGKDINCCPICKKGRMLQSQNFKPAYFKYIVPHKTKEVYDTS